MVKLQKGEMAEKIHVPTVVNLKNDHISCKNRINRDTDGSNRRQTLLEQILIILGRTQIRLHVILCVAVLFLTQRSRWFSSTTFHLCPEGFMLHVHILTLHMQ